MTLAGFVILVCVLAVVAYLALRRMGVDEERGARQARSPGLAGHSPAARQCGSLRTRSRASRRGYRNARGMKSRSSSSNIPWMTSAISAAGMAPARMVPTSFNARPRTIRVP